MEKQITQTEVKELFDYREDGNLIRIKSCMGNGNYAGRVIGSIVSGGKDRPDKKYRMTRIHGKSYAVHKLVYMWHYGEAPIFVDHVNRDSLDNRIENLRPATASQNMQNRKTFKNSTSGCKGVSWHKYSHKWMAYIGLNKKLKCLGYFHDRELAELVAIEARAKYHGKFSNYV